MSIDIDDFMQTLVSIEGATSIGQVYSDCVADSFEEGMLPRSSVWGSIVGGCRFVVDPKGGSHRESAKNTLAKTKKAFVEFLQYLAHPQKQPSRLTKAICSLCHSPEWVKRLRKMQRLMRVQLKFPVDVGVRLSSPIVFEQLTATDVPWAILEKIVRNQKIDPKDGPRLKCWLDIIQTNLADIPKELIVGTFRQVAHNVYPRKSEKALTDEAFSLVLLLNQKYENIFNEDNSFEKSVLEKLREKMSIGGEKLPIEFHQRFQASVYPLLDQPSRCLLTSPRPLLLGVLERYLLRKENIFPLLTVHERGEDGEYLIVEALSSSLDKVDWGRSKGLSKDLQSLADALAVIVQKALTLDMTYDLQLKSLFVTKDHKICLVEELPKKYDYFSLKDLELFIDAACQGDVARRIYVMEKSGFFADKYTQIFARVLQTIQDPHQEISEKEVDAVLYGYDLHTDEFRDTLIAEYLSPMSECMRDAIGILKREIPSETLITIIIGLQHELGFVTKIPANFTRAIVKKVREQKFFKEWKMTQTSMQLRSRVAQHFEAPVIKDKEQEGSQQREPSESSSRGDDTQSALSTKGLFERIVGRWAARWEKVNLQ